MNSCLTWFWKEKDGKSHLSESRQVSNRLLWTKSLCPLACLSSGRGCSWRSHRSLLSWSRSRGRGSYRAAWKPQIALGSRPHRLEKKALSPSDMRGLRMRSALLLVVPATVAEIAAAIVTSARNARKHGVAADEQHKVSYSQSTTIGIPPWSLNKSRCIGRCP